MMEIGTILLRLSYDGDRYDTVLVALAIRYDGGRALSYIVYDTTLACSAVPYDGNRLQCRMMEIDTILYIHDEDCSQYLQRLALSE